MHLLVAPEQAGQIGQVCCQRRRLCKPSTAWLRSVSEVCQLAAIGTGRGGAEGAPACCFSTHQLAASPALSRPPPTRGSFQPCHLS